MGRLREELLQYTASDYYPFHMPGHKRKGIGSTLDDIYKINEELNQPLYWSLPSKYKSQG